MAYVESVTTLSSSGAASTPILLDGRFNVLLTPSSDWNGELRIQATFDDPGGTSPAWTDEVAENGGIEWGAEQGRFVGEEVEQGGVWYRASAPVIVTGSMTIRFSQ